ncbi:High-affinity nicotinic acid transporter [Lachnellula occidentalis]|uniref:High-affinity nicotinic acid transporter n=1 Tax=Lachnellula occidentalis TaxID=215460 RepID=A0A8H8UBK9_9HELO|nr:High-affinity nicotinic acid transporter [Lachnellula occidentalis]
MASSESSPTLDRKPSDEKQVGFNAPIDIMGIDAPAALEPSHAAEYLEFLELKDHFESDPKAYKSLVRRQSNAGNVKIYTFLKDTHMTGHQFNLALTWYFFTYAFLEAPSNMCMRKYGPRLWLSGLVFCWGAVTLGTAWVTSYHGYSAARVMLGVFEAGLFQGFYTLSCWYVSGELQTRCAYWYSATMVSGAFGGLLAYAVGGLQGRLGLKQWQYLFIIEGSLTMFVGLLGFWLCVDFPESWSSRFFKADEMRFLQLRVKYQDGPVSPDEEFRWSAFWEAVKDWKTYFIASLLAFGGSVPTYSVNYTLATMVKSLGYSSIKAQALTAPPYVFAFFCVIGIAIYSDKYRCRARSLLISYAIGTIGIVILWPCLYHQNLAGVSYFALFLVVAGYNMQAPAVGSWLGTNVRNPAKRAAAMGWQSTFGQLLGGTIGANIFLDKEAPTYQTGFIIIIVLVMVGGVGATIANWYFLRASNLKKDKIPLEELEGKYTEHQLSEMGEYSPYFRYAYIFSRL